MKKTVLAAFGALLSVVSLHSCLDFDMPTDTFTGGDTELDPIVYKGKADSIDYRKEISEEGFAFAEKELNNYFFQLQTVQYCMRGGKEGQLPGAHQYQYVYNITVDNYAGYLCVPHNFSHGGDGILSSTYYYNRGYCDGPYGSFSHGEKQFGEHVESPSYRLYPRDESDRTIALQLFGTGDGRPVWLYSLCRSQE